jgi:hypothetical protein
MDDVPAVASARARRAESYAELIGVAGGDPSCARLAKTATVGVDDIVSIEPPVTCDKCDGLVRAVRCLLVVTLTGSPNSW